MSKQEKVILESLADRVNELEVIYIYIYILFITR